MNFRTQEPTMLEAYHINWPMKFMKPGDKKELYFGVVPKKDFIYRLYASIKNMHIRSSGMNKEGFLFTVKHKKNSIVVKCHESIYSLEAKDIFDNKEYCWRYIHKIAQVTYNFSITQDKKDKQSVESFFHTCRANISNLNKRNGTNLSTSQDKKTKTIKIYIK